MPPSSNPSEHLRRLEQLLVALPIAIVNLDGRSRVRCCNPAFEALFRYPAAEARGRSLSRLVGLERTSEAAAALRALARGRAVHVMMQAERKDRCVVDVEFFGVGDGTTHAPDHWGLFQDVTARDSTLSRVTRSLIDAHERERLRVSRDLHNDIGQRLAACQLAMDRVTTAMHGSCKAIAREVAVVRSQAAAASDNVRRLSQELYSPTLTLLSIDEALADLCAEMSVRLRMAIRFSSRGIPPSVPPALSQCLFRIVQDTIRIAAHHGGARRATVDVRGSRGVIHLCIREFGRQAAQKLADEEFRFITMHARVAAVNGTLSRTSDHRGGTRIDVDVPL